MLLIWNMLFWTYVTHAPSPIYGNVNWWGGTSDHNANHCRFVGMHWDLVQTIFKCTNDDMYIYICLFLHMYIFWKVQTYERGKSRECSVLKKWNTWDPFFNMVYIGSVARRWSQSYKLLFCDWPNPNWIFKNPSKNDPNCIIQRGVSFCANMFFSLTDPYNILWQYHDRYYCHYH